MKESAYIPSDYLCYCKQITEQDLQGAFAKNPRQSFVDLVEKTGVGTQCAACEFEVRSLFDDWRADQGIQAELHTSWRDLRTPKLSLKEYFRRRFGKTKPSCRNGLFALRDQNMETRFVVSNLNLPENGYNPNGPFVKVTAEFFHSDGTKGAESRPRVIKANGTAEFTLKELFPGLPERVMGAVYLDFHELHMTHSLRSYGILCARDAAGKVTGRSHYHDKFAKFIDPGFFQTAWPFAPGQECWMAACNCMDIPYESEAVLRTGASAEQKVPFELGPMSSRWTRVSDLFAPPTETDPGLFYLESPQHVMVWFFWRHIATGAWIGQHH